MVLVRHEPRDYTGGPEGCQRETRGVSAASATPLRGSLPFGTGSNGEARRRPPRPANETRRPAASTAITDRARNLVTSCCLKIRGEPPRVSVRGGREPHTCDAGAGLGDNARKGRRSRDKQAEELGARVRDHTVTGRAEKDGQRAGVTRWPATVAPLAVGAVYAAVSGGLTLGPRLLVPILILLLVVALMSAHSGVDICWPDASRWS